LKDSAAVDAASTLHAGWLKQKSAASPRFTPSRVWAHVRVCGCVSRRVRAEAASALRDAAKRLAESEAEVSQLRGDVNALQEELDDRPTPADQR
jgi:outer membrane murein-binding lipoprotein Lpp